MWTGSATQTDLNTSSSVIASADTGTYTVNVSSSIGCPGNSVTTVISGPLSPPVPSCNVIYVEPSGVGTGFTRNSPTNLLNALNLAQCNSVVIKMTTGNYVISNPITTLTSFVTLEGGYDASYNTKKSLPGGLTTITRDANNVQGQTSAPRLVAFEITGQSNFRLQDITIETDNGPSASSGNPKGVSTYGLYLNNCSNYDIVRCQILPGDASTGLIGNDGLDGDDGNNGLQGGAGSCDGNCVFPDFTCNESAPGGNGGAGGAGAVGVAGPRAGRPGLLRAPRCRGCRRASNRG